MRDEAKPLKSEKYNDVTWKKGEMQPSAYRDVHFAILFYAQIATLIGIFVFHKSNNQIEDSATLDTKSNNIWNVIIVSFIAATIASSFALTIMVRLGDSLITFSLYFSIWLYLFSAVAALFNGQTVLSLFLFAATACMVCYARAVQSRIPFAAANLETGIAAVTKNLGLVPLAFGVVTIATAFVALWYNAFTAFYDTTCFETSDDIEECGSPSIGIVIPFILSLYWTLEVAKNLIHVTVGGTVGTFWFTPEEASSVCSPAVTGSFERATTTSFGSICFGSLLVAIVKTLRYLSEIDDNNDNVVGSMLKCIARCLLAFIEGMLEYFNKWAFVYVALYGYSFVEAGKNVLTLFQERGWETIIADDLVSGVLSLVNISIALITGGISVAFVAIFGDGTMDTAVVFGVGCVIGFFTSYLVMSVIESSVNTVIVLFAEAPYEFEQGHRALSDKMRQAYSKAHGSVCQF